MKLGTIFSYGDKAPRSAPARVFGLVWMFGGIILMAVFTATLTTAFQIDTSFDVDEVHHAKVLAMQYFNTKLELTK